MADLSIAKMYMNRRPKYKSWDEAYTDTNKLAGQQRISDIMQNSNLTADQKRSASREALASYDPTAAMNMDYRDARDSKKDELTRQLQLAKDLKARDPMASRAKLLSILDNYLDMLSTAKEKGWPTKELNLQIARIKTQIQSDNTSIQKAFTPGIDYTDIDTVLAAIKKAGSPEDIKGVTQGIKSMKNTWTPEQIKTVNNAISLRLSEIAKGGDSMYDFEVSYGGEDAPEAKTEPDPEEPPATDTYTPEMAMKQIRATKSLKELAAVRDHMVTTAKTWSKEQVKRVSEIVEEQKVKLTPKSRPRTTDAVIKKEVQAALANVALFSLASSLSTSAPEDKYTLFKVKSRVFTPENVTDGDAAASKSRLEKIKAAFSKGVTESVSEEQAVAARASIKETYQKALTTLKTYMGTNYFSGVSKLHVQMMKDAIKNNPWREAKSSGKSKGRASYTINATPGFSKAKAMQYFKRAKENIAKGIHIEMSQKVLADLAEQGIK